MIHRLTKSRIVPALLAALLVFTGFFSSSLTAYANEPIKQPDYILKGNYNGNFSLTTDNTQLFNATNVGPGDVWETDIKVSNNGSSTMHFRVMEIKNNLTAGVQLFDILKLKLTDSQGNILYDGSYAAPNPVMEFVKIDGKATETITASVSFPIDANNTYMNAKLDSTWVFEANYPKPEDDGGGGGTTTPDKEEDKEQDKEEDKEDTTEQPGGGGGSSSDSDSDSGSNNNGNTTAGGGDTIGGVTIPDNIDSVTVPNNKLDEVEKDNNGNITLPDGTEIETGGKDITVTEGEVIIKPDGTIVVPDDSTIVVTPDGSTSGKDEVEITGPASVDKNGNVTVESGGTIGGVTIPDGIDSVTIPSNKVDEVEKDNNGNITVPEGSKIEVGGTNITVTDGEAVIKPNGTVTVPDGTITVGKDKTEVSGNITVDKNGNVTVESGGTIGGVKIPDNIDSVTVPANKLNEVEKDKVGNVVLPDGSTIDTNGSDIKVTDGEISIKPDGTIVVPDDSTIVVTPDGSTSKKDEIEITGPASIDKNGNVTVESGGTIGGVTIPNGIDSVTIPSDKLDEVRNDVNGNIVVPTGTVLEIGGSKITLTEGEAVIKSNGTINVPNGTITVGKDKTEISGNITLNKNGDITIEAGGSINDIKLPTNINSVTIPANKVDEVEIDKDGNISLPTGTSVIDNNGNKITLPEGGLIKEDGSSITFNEGQIIIGNTSIELPMGVEGVISLEDGYMKVPLGSYVVLDGREVAILKGDITVYTDGSIDIAKDNMVYIGGITITGPATIDKLGNIFVGEGGLIEYNQGLTSKPAGKEGENYYEYEVLYLDTYGNELHESKTLYGKLGETYAEFAVDIEGYTPVVNNKSITIKANNDGKMVFIYVKDSVGNKQSHLITVEDTENGKVDVDFEEAAEGTKVTVTITPDSGYKLGKFEIIAENSNSIPFELVSIIDGTYTITFIMPDSPVSINTTFDEGEIPADTITVDESDDDGFNVAAIIFVVVVGGGLIIILMYKKKTGNHKE